ncbi:MAG TPA: PD-(D/E)XK nuclease family protein [Bryobacteraceae bacterium]|nr:PD-(D/E)XK nuclease family protein [Bryobacteraceae bacterium]
MLHRVDELSASEEELHAFFSALSERLKIIADYEARVARFEAPRFNLFDGTYIGSPENKITEIIRDLLDPKGSHGQGEIFLRRFLKRVGFERAVNADIAKARVKTQHFTQEGRPIDLTIRIGKYILGLENKIGAREQKFQVADYIKEISSSQKDDYFFVFLSRHKDRDPETCDPAEWKRLKQQHRACSLSYSELADWLSCCSTLSRSNRVRVLLCDMAEWAGKIEGERVSDSLTEKTVSDFIIQHKEYVQASLAVCNASGSLKRALVQQFARAVEDRALNELEAKWGSDWSFVARLSESGIVKDAGILLQKSSWQESCRIGIETWSDRFIFGVKWPQAPVEAQRQLRDALNEKITRCKEASEIWPWCPYVPDFQGLEVHRNWQDCKTLEILHGERSADIIEHFSGLIIAVAEVVVPLLDENAQRANKG